MPRRNLRKDLWFITWEGIAFSLMVGMGEAYLPAFALAVGVGEISAGLLLTLPVLMGALLQLATPYLVQRIGSYSVFTALASLIQGLSFIPLILGALIGDSSEIVIYGVAALYWASGMATGPAWNSWMAELIPARIRTKYFARRTSLAQAAVLLSLLAAGASLQLAAQEDNVLLAFAILFSLAGAARLISAYLHTRPSRGFRIAVHFRWVKMREIMGRINHSHEIRLLIFFLSLQVAVHIATPFFTPYMLGELQLSYLQYMTLLAASFVAKIITLPLWGRRGHESNTRKLLWFGSLGVVPISALWLVNQSFYYLLGLQIVAGVVWGAYELAVILLVFETLRAEERVALLTIFNLAQALAMAAGSLLGGMMLSTLGSGPLGYSIIFALSTVARAIAVILLKWVGQLPASQQRVPLRTLAVRASEGSIDPPIVSAQK